MGTLCTPQTPSDSDSTEVDDSDGSDPDRDVAEPVRGPVEEATRVVGALLSADRDGCGGVCLVPPETPPASFLVQSLAGPVGPVTLLGLFLLQCTCSFFFFFFLGGGGSSSPPPPP